MWKYKALMNKRFRAWGKDGKRDYEVKEGQIFTLPQPLTEGIDFAEEVKEEELKVKKKVRGEKHGRNISTSMD